jgi:hypothetical protein
MEFCWESCWSIIRCRHILADNRNERKPEGLIQIGDELVARHFGRGAVIVNFRFVRQVPGHVLRIPPRVLQALPKQPRLPDPPDLVPPCDDALLAILHHQLAQRIHQVGPQLFEPLVVRPQRKFRQRFLRIRRRLLAVNPKRRARRICALRGMRAIERRDAAIVRSLIFAVQDGQVDRICLLICHGFQ